MSASTCCSSSSKSCTRSCRSFTKRSPRRWRRSTDRKRATLESAGDPAFRFLGGRRHGRQSGRACEDDSRNDRAPSAADRQQLLSRMSGAPGRRSRKVPRASRSARELQARIDHYMVVLPAASTLTPARHDRMPYRVFSGPSARTTALNLRRSAESIRSGERVPRRHAI